jgi:hypothetical protein
MKFLVSWQVDQDKWLPVLKKWSSLTPQQRADAGPGVKIIGRWHNTAGRGGTAVVEATDLAAMNRYLGQWNPYMDLTIAPVLDDEESAALAKTVLQDHGA